ncbi:hypothetical protein, partial [Burkholderia pseudomallei]
KSRPLGLVSITVRTRPIRTRPTRFATNKTSSIRLISNRTITFTQPTPTFLIGKNMYASQRFTTSKFALLTATLQADLDRVECELRTRIRSANQYTSNKEKDNFSDIAELAATLRAKLAAIDNRNGAASNHLETDC